MQQTKSGTSKIIHHKDGRECLVTYGKYGTEYREMGKSYKKRPAW